MLKFVPVVAAVLLAHSAFAQNDAIAVSVSPLEYQVPGNPKFNFVFSKTFAGMVGNCTIGWQLDNGTPQTVTKTASQLWYSGPLGIVRDPAFTVNLPAPGTYTLKAWIKMTNPVDANASNDTITQVINVHQTLPKKNVVLEVFKHQGCAPCYPAATYLNDYVSKHPEYAIVQIYNGKTDVLFNQEGQTVDSTYGGFGHPIALYDRFKFPFYADWGHSFSTSSGGDTLKEFGERARYYEPVFVSFKNASFNETTRELKVKIGANFFADYSGDHRFNLYVTEDDIKAFQSSAPDPNNYIHKRVLRKMVGGSWGQQGSLPATIKKGSYHEYEFTYTIPAAYNVNKLRLTAVVQAYNSDDKKRPILNSDHRTFAQALSINQAKQPVEASVYPNPATNQLTIAFGKPLQKSCDIVLLDMNGKVCRSMRCAGTTTMDISTLTAGSYLLHIDDGDVVHTQAIIKQ